ncbi:hypothetical protein GLOIN_2v1781616 [Rhizophagus irregularis DAOM 181602=DAOM 197198]|nr:hypothetical protein GLOIN_2v1781616 [Rhizophagus irregularis DAOM 181602=DAOM 197198]
MEDNEPQVEAKTRDDWTQVRVSPKREYIATYKRQIIEIWKLGNKSSNYDDQSHIVNIDDEHKDNSPNKLDTVNIKELPLNNNYEFFQLNDISNEKLLIFTFRNVEGVSKLSNGLLNSNLAGPATVYDHRIVIYDVDGKRILMNKIYKKNSYVFGNFLEAEAVAVDYVAIYCDEVFKGKIHLYAINNNNIKLKHSYVIPNTGDFGLEMLLPTGNLFLTNGCIIQQWNIINGNLEKSYQFNGASTISSFKVNESKDLLLIIKYQSKSLSVFSKETDIIFSHHFEFEIMNIEFCEIKGFDFLIVQEYIKDNNKSNYHLINPFSRNKSQSIKKIETQFNYNDGIQFIMDEKLIKVFDDKVQVEDLLTENEKNDLLNQVYKDTPICFMLNKNRINRMKKWIKEIKENIKENESFELYNKIELYEYIYFFDDMETIRKWKIENENESFKLYEGNSVEMIEKNMREKKSVEMIEMIKKNKSENKSVEMIEMIKKNKSEKSISWVVKIVNKELQITAKSSHFLIFIEDIFLHKFLFYAFILPNDDLIIFEKDDKDKIIRIYRFTINTKTDKIDFLCVYTDVEYSKSYFKSILEYLNKNNSKEPDLIECYKKTISFYLDDISSFTLHASEILQAAIEAQGTEIINRIIEKCIKYYNEGSDQEHINIFVIITKSLSELQDSYPYHLNKFLIYTNLISTPYDDPTFKRDYIYFIGYDKNSLKLKYSLYVPLPQFASYPSKEQIELAKRNVNTITKIVNDELSRLLNLIGNNGSSLNGVVSFRDSKEKLVNSIPEIPPENENDFVNMQIPDIYSDWNGEALINFKWFKFGRNYYHGIWLLYTIFLLTFTLASTKPTGFISSANQKILFIISVVLGFFQLLILEIQIFLRHPKKYTLNPWNFFDLCAYIFPIVTSILWLKNGSTRVWISAVSNLFLDVKFLLFFRAIEYFGVYFAIILNVAKSVFSFLLILWFVILAYTHAFFTLLQPVNKFNPSTPNFDDNDKNSPWSLTNTYNSLSSDGKTVSTNPTLIQIPTDNTNLYEYFDTSFLAVYKLMTGDTGSLAQWVFRDNPTLVVLWISFSFFTVIYLLNLFIGLLNNEIQKSNDKSWFLVQKAELIADIEQCCLLPFQRQWKSWFPDHIFYCVDVDKLHAKINDIEIKYKDNPHRPILSRKLLEFVGKKVDDMNENSKHILENVKSKLLENKNHEISKFKFSFETKDSKLVTYEEKMQDSNDDK